MKSNLQSNPFVLDTLTEEEFYLFENADIYPLNTILLSITDVLQYDWRIYSPLMLSIKDIPPKYRDN
jgi:hypothetical protein